MNLKRKKTTQKGETNMYFILLGVLLTLAVLFTAKYFHDRDNGAVIQLPKVDLH
jgi:hypothetical protein